MARSAEEGKGVMGGRLALEEERVEQAQGKGGGQPMIMAMQKI